MVISNPKQTDLSKLKKTQIKRKRTGIKKRGNILGMTFYHMLSWRKHIDKLVTKCQNDLNVMRAVSGTSFGADKLTLKTYTRS